jgi:VWFA-related protein
MCRVRRWLAIAGLTLLLPLSLRTQTAESNATFRSSAELVLVPTVINDKSGIHIAGLRKEDFVLKQDGKPYPIAVFEEVKTSSAPVRRSEGEHGTFSNFEPGGSDYHRLNIIVLDFMNTPFSDLANAQNEMLKFLSEAAESGEPMCLLALTRGGLTLLHDFTDDPKLLAAALRETESNSAPLVSDPIVDPGHPQGNGLAATLTKLIRDQLQSEAALESAEAKEAALTTVQALQQIAKAFRGLPGRKSLIWASSGFPFSLSPPSSLMCEPACPTHQLSEVQSAYDNLWRMMNDAQIAIYSVDLRSAVTGRSMSSGGVRPSDIGDPEFDTSSYLRTIPGVKHFWEAAIWSRAFVRPPKMTAATTCSVTM